MKISRLCRLPKAGPACLNDGPHQRSINQAEACTAASQCTASLVGGCRGLEVRCFAEQRQYRRLRAPETITPPHVIAHNTRRCTCQCASSASANAHAVVARLRRFACTLGRRDMPTRMGAWRDARHCNAAPTRARTVPFDVAEAFVCFCCLLRQAERGRRDETQFTRHCRRSRGDGGRRDVSLTTVIKRVIDPLLPTLATPS